MSGRHIIIASRVGHVTLWLDYTPTSHGSGAVSLQPQTRDLQIAHYEPITTKINALDEALMAPCLSEFGVGRGA